MKKQVITLLMLLVATISFAQYRISTEGTSKTFTIQDLSNANDFGESFPRDKVFGDKISATRVRIKIEGVTYNPKVLIKNQGIDYSEFRDGNNSDATFANAEAVDAWFKENTGFKTASGGSGAVLSSFYSSLENAFNSGNNIVLPKSSTITTGSVNITTDNVYIDLNGSTLISDGTAGEILSIRGSNVHIYNGTINGANLPSDTHNIVIRGDDVTLDRISSINSKRDAIYIIDDEFETTGIGDRFTLTNSIITNPDRHGVQTVSDNTIFRDWIKIDNLTINDDDYTGYGLFLSYIDNASINKIKSDGGFDDFISLGRINHGSLTNSVIKESTMGTTEGLDMTYMGTFTIENNYFEGKELGVNPSNTSNNISIINNWFVDVKSGIIQFESFGETTISKNKFYNSEIGISSNNNSMLKIVDNYFNENKIAISLGGTNADSKVNYLNMKAYITNNTINATGNEAVRVLTGISAAKYDYIKISDNVINDVHTITSAKSFWDSYTPINNNAYAISITAPTSGDNGNVYIHDNDLIQSSAYATGVAGGGVEYAILVSDIDFLSIVDNNLSRNCKRAIRLSETTIDSFFSSEFVESEQIDLSGSSYSIIGYPQLYSGDYIGTEMIYTEGASADSGIDIRIKDGVTGTVKSTITTSPSAAAGEIYREAYSNLNIAQRRTIQIETSGGKTGAGNVFLRTYYVSLR